MRTRLWMEKREGLPHIRGNGLKMYPWQARFYNSTNRINLLTACNQGGKSTAQIRRFINHATDTTLWKALWPRSTPKQFWYFYPDGNTATAEFEEKWVPEFLPRGKFRDDPQYGWKAKYGDKSQIKILEFNSGISIYFKTYEQKIKNLQASTVHEIGCDEEPPEEFMPEIISRLSAANVKGYFNAVFTATLGQDFWRLAMEPRQNEVEKFPDALKQTVSLYDCMFYEDGSPGPWTEELIEQRIRECPNENEVQRRVFGKFVSDGGRAYQSYSPDVHFIKPKIIPADWRVYSGLDYGAGGTSHPSGILFIAVRPDHQLAYVFKCWRGDGIETTASDVIDKWQEMGRGHHLVQSVYDWSAKDLGTIATRQGHNLTKADKSRDLGAGTLNTLFRNNMLFIFDDDEGQGAKLSGELIALKETVNKSKAKDDLIDPLRYVCVSIPWDWEAIRVKEEVKKDIEPKLMFTEEQLKQMEFNDRRGIKNKDEANGWSELDAEFDEWNDTYG